MGAPLQPHRTPIAAVATLADESRHGMYEFIRAAGRPVTREEAAGSVGISRKLAAFHLDKLVEAGLLRVSVDRGGTHRVGRAPKVYQPADRDIQVRIPERRPELLADILLDGMTAELRGESARKATIEAARTRGWSIGAIAREVRRPGRLGAERALNTIERLLTENGFEPIRPDRTRLRLLVCPFTPLTSRDPTLVCGISHALLAGIADGLGTCAVDVVLMPGVGGCCVEVRPSR